MDKDPQRETSSSDIARKSARVWTTNNLYFLFVCPYEQLKSQALRRIHNQETQQNFGTGMSRKCFLGSDFQDIQRYKGFEISPQGDWIDLDYRLAQSRTTKRDWTWNSGFEVLARIDPKTHIWYGAMRNPVEAIDSRPLSSRQQVAESTCSAARARLRKTTK